MANERATVTRRTFLLSGGAIVSTACLGAPVVGHTGDSSEGRSRDGRLTARPTSTSTSTTGSGSASASAAESTSRSRSTPAAAAPLAPGEHPLGLGGRRDGLIYIPRELPPKSPLVVLLHGATGSAKGIMTRLSAQSLADELRFVVLAIDSRGTTWDMIGGQFGPDAEFFDGALAHTFAHTAIDPDRVAIAGFSDGASAALSFGLVNGDLFTHVLAFSPGFVVASEGHGRPEIYISHGVRDGILPIDSTSRRLVPWLRRSGYHVDYKEFPGVHEVPPHIAREALTWVVGQRPAI